MLSPPVFLKPLFLSVLSGLLLWLGWPVSGMAGLLFVGFVPVLLLEQGFSERIIKRKRQGLFGYFYLAFFIWNLGTTWWIYNSTGVGAVLALGCNTLFMTLIWLLFHITKIKLGNATGYISLIVYWIAFEKIHLDWDLSWPWLTLGNGFASNVKWIQWYEYTGILGGSMWILLANILLFLLIKKWIAVKNLKSVAVTVKEKIDFPVLYCAIALILFPILFSEIMYAGYKEKTAPCNVVVVQPNIDPYNEKFNGSEANQVAKLLALSSTEVDSATDYLVAPETALPNGVWEDEIHNALGIKTIKAFIHTFPQLTFIGGLSSLKAYKNRENIPLTARKFDKSEMYFDAFNSAMQLDEGDSIQLYHKSKLVPGVEKMPYPAIFGFLENYAISLGGTSGSLGMQKERTVFTSAKGVKVAPAICYESIYGDFLSGYIRNGAQLIFIITNDGWWGNTPGYKQHAAYGRLRAIEFRRSIARSANTGISCFINQRGDVEQPTPWWTEEVIKAKLNKNDVLTFYGLHGDFIGWLCLAASVLMLLWVVISRWTKE